MRLVNAYLMNVPNRPRGPTRPPVYPTTPQAIRREAAAETRERIQALHRPPPPPLRPVVRAAQEAREAFQENRPYPGRVRQEVREEVRERAVYPGPVRREVREEVLENRPYPGPIRRDIRQEVREEAREAWQEATPWVEDPWESFGDEQNTQVQTSDQVVTQAVGQAVAQLQEGYGPLAQMSANLRIQAAKGYRAGVIRLKNGMFLVVEIHESALEPQFGAAEVLAPMVVNAAVKALENPDLQKAVVDTAAQGIQAMGRGFSQLGRHQPRRPLQGARRPPVPAHRPPTTAARLQPPPGYMAWPAGYFPGYAPTYPYVPVPVSPPMPSLPAVAPVRRLQAGQQRAEYLSDALPWADYEDFAGVGLED